MYNTRLIGMLIKLMIKTLLYVVYNTGFFFFFFDYSTRFERCVSLLLLGQVYDALKMLMQGGPGQMASSYPHNLVDSD